MLPQTSIYRHHTFQTFVKIDLKIDDLILARFHMAQTNSKNDYMMVY